MFGAAIYVFLCDNFVEVYILVSYTQIIDTTPNSAVLVLYHPGASQQQTSQAVGPPAHLAATGHTFIHDYYMFTSYVMPAAQLVISDYKDPNNHHNVTFKVRK